MHLRQVAICPERFPTAKHYPFDLPILRQTRRLAFTTPVTLLAGENGTGKSTLLTALVRKAGIHIWKGLTRARFENNPYEQQLHKAIDIAWTNGPVPGSFFSSQDFQSFARLLDDWASATPGVLGYFGGKSLMTQSHGQSLMAYFRSRYAIKGIYFADEPETALSPRTQIELLRVLRDMGQAGHAQFIIATHSPILLACPGATIYSFDHAPVQQVAYEDTEHYQLYCDFMADRRRYLDAPLDP